MTTFTEEAVREVLEHSKDCLTLSEGPTGYGCSLAVIPEGCPVKDKALLSSFTVGHNDFLGSLYVKDCGHVLLYTDPELFEYALGVLFSTGDFHLLERIEEVPK